MKDYETLERVKLICDEKANEFQSFSDSLVGVDEKARRPLMHGRVWHLFFDFQLELLKAGREGVAATDIDPMEAAAIDAGYIKDVRDNPPSGDEYLALKDFIPGAPVKVRVTNHYFYPQDISEAQEGDIWHDLDGRPHFCLGDGWIEARGFMPNCAEGQMAHVKTVEGKHSEVPIFISAGQWARTKGFEFNQIKEFRMV